MSVLQTFQFSASPTFIVVIAPNACRDSAESLEQLAVFSTPILANSAVAFLLRMVAEIYEMVADLTQSVRNAFWKNLQSQLETGEHQSTSSDAHLLSPVLMNAPRPSSLIQ